jgi:ATP-dependent Lon protease
MKPNKIPKILTVFPVTDSVIFPKMKSKSKVSDELGKQLGSIINSGAPFAVTLTVKAEMENELKPGNFYQTGTLVNLESLQKANEGYIVHFRALERVITDSIQTSGDYMVTNYTFSPFKDDLDPKSQQSMMDFIMETITKISDKFHGAEQYIKQLKKVTDFQEVIGQIMPFLQASVQEKQNLLERDSKKQFGVRFIDMLMSQKDSINFQIEMAKKFHEKVNRAQREAMLREQLKAIKEELGEGKKSAEGKKEYRNLIEAAGMPEEVKETALEQVVKMESIGNENYEGTIIRNYLDLMVALPWKPGAQKEIDIDQARATLNQDHYGIAEVKKRIAQHLAVMKLKKSIKGSILLFVGPPGTGKTSLGKSIARAMGRKYQRLSLGGIRDEAEIRGHRRTYIGALPGRIINGMKKAGEKNPVFVLDEVDKLMIGYSGDPASALLEVLDPEQNSTFTDHYLEVPYDLSEVFFIATANTTASIPAPLLDRMEVIEMTGYTSNEKFHIARNHLIPAVWEDTGLNNDSLIIEDTALEEIITNYTREAGVRGFKKELSKIARGVSEHIVSQSGEKPYTVSKDKLRNLLGKQKIRLDSVDGNNPPGVVTGLAWTPVGGDILFIEATTMPGRGSLILTGQLGDVMKESARISMSLIQSRLAAQIGGFSFKKHDFHIHVPSGAIPKDGPSAGITLLTALASLMINKPVDSKLAMTGEITLRGSVLPVGGIKEKMLAAHRAGIKQVILPLLNKEDVADIPEEVRDDLVFHYAETIEEVIQLTLKITMDKLLIATDDTTPFVATL